MTLTLPSPSAFRAAAALRRASQGEGSEGLAIIWCYPKAVHECFATRTWPGRQANRFTNAGGE